MLCSAALAPTWPRFSEGLEAGSVQMAIRLPMLQSDWLVSDVSEEPDMLRSSPPADGQYEDETARKDNIDKTEFNQLLKQKLLSSIKSIKVSRHLHGCFCSMVFYHIMGIINHPCE